MPLTAAQAQQVTQFASQYDAKHETLSFVDWLKANGQAKLASDLVAMLTAAGDTQTLAQITSTPAVPASAPKPLTPAQSWAQYAQPSAAPAKGKAWGLSSAGKWRQVPIAPGGQFSGPHYIPPQRPGGPREPTEADVRFVDAKRIAACATCLANDWRALFFRVAPRGAPDQHGVSPGIGTIDAGIDYFYEGGDIYPELTAAQPSEWQSVSTQALALWAWWQNPPWPTWYTRADSMGWYRVYVDSSGFRAYRKWTLKELQDFRVGYMLAAPGYRCPRQEVFRDAMYDVGRNCKIDMHGTTGTALEMCQVFPLARCSVSQTEKRNQMIKEAAAVAGVVAAAVFLPTVAPKLVGALEKFGHKVGGALASKFTGSVKSAISGAEKLAQAVKSTHAQAINQESPPVAANGQQLPPPPPPPPPTGNSAADTQTYAAALANWYAQQHAANTGQAPPSAAEQAQLAAETQRFLVAGAQVASGAANPNVAAADLATSPLGGAVSGKTVLIGFGALAAVLLASRRTAA